MSLASPVKNKCNTLLDRAKMFQSARAFFSEREIAEVDCPILSTSSAIDVQIDPMTVPIQQNTRYLHTSPEHGMKRLLSMGMPDIYQISHVFRQGEFGKRHNPEFTLVEWYRLGFSFEEMVRETADFIQLFIGQFPLESLTYSEAFLNYLGIDPLNSSQKALNSCLTNEGISGYAEIEKEEREGYLNLLLAEVIEPQLGQNKLTALTHYPASQAALARKIEGTGLAQRFEIYFNGVELANGYYELSDPKEQKERYQEANRQRVKSGKAALPLDTHFLSALEKGLPDCCGVAVGFDRLMMLRHKTDTLADVIPFDWEEA